MEFLQARWGCENPSPRRRRTTDPPAPTPPRPLRPPHPTLPSPLRIKKKKKKSPGWAGVRRVEEGEERMDGAPAVARVVQTSWQQPPLIDFSAGRPWPPPCIKTWGWAEPGGATPASPSSSIFSRLLHLQRRANVNRFAWFACISPCGLPCYVVEPRRCQHSASFTCPCCSFSSRQIGAIKTLHLWKSNEPSKSFWVTSSWPNSPFSFIQSLIY